MIRLTPPAALALILALAGCGNLTSTAPQPLPSAMPAAPAASDLAQGAALHQEALRRLNPPAGQRPDTAEAAALVERAARLGDPEAQLLLATGLLAEADDDEDRASAASWLNRAAHQGQSQAQYRLGRLLEEGSGTPREPAWAAVWFQRAAERGQAEAHFALALLQIAGEGTAQAPAEALARLTLAERRGVPGVARYRAALQPRVPPAEARRALARVQAETARGAVAPVDRALVRFVQSALARLGRWNQPVDGVDGPAVRAALAEFARAEGRGGAAAYDPGVIDLLRARLRR
ncbi:SEL1-like repeat protein [Roseomonas sp. PWR1]|uniref:SEL1-like repeat protein n=1 Tax=Roseomonas nitratireducens TaxID=2820810 RepID=A0ABS4AWP7_9PROT|nr:SEL1-like repeat protein [Neoroseomonas nitratireducens]MBP0465784.1 SEL1-like repeat protein [Neoroseomonas nitratireducens]